MKSIAFLLFFLAYGQATAQCIATDPASKQWLNTAQVAVNDAREVTRSTLDQVRPYLLPSQQRLADPTKFLVGAYHEFNGKFDPVRKEIHLPLGLWLETWLIVDAIADIYEQSDLAPKFGGYLQFLRACAKRIHATSLAQPLLTFRQWAKIPPRIPGTPAVETARKKIQLDMLKQATAFVIIHELAHLLMDHVASGDLTSADSYRQEFDADIRARRLMEVSGFDLIPAVSVIGRLAILQISDDNQLIRSNTHPHPVCRMYRTFTTTVYKGKNDPVARAYVERFGLNFDQLIQSLLIGKEAC